MLSSGLFYLRMLSLAKASTSTHLGLPKFEVAMARLVVLASLMLASALGNITPAAAQDTARTVAAAQPGRNRDLPLDPARTVNIDTDQGS